MANGHTTPAPQTADADADGSAQARAVGRHWLGAELRKLRHGQSLRLEDVAARLDLAPSTLSRMETGQAPVKDAYLLVMLGLYRVEDQAKRVQLAKLARDGRREGWHDGYRELLPAGVSHYLDLGNSRDQRVLLLGPRRARPGPDRRLRRCCHRRDPARVNPQADPGTGDPPGPPPATRADR